MLVLKKSMFLVLGVIVLSLAACGQSASSSVVNTPDANQSNGSESAVENSSEKTEDNDEETVDYEHKEEGAVVSAFDVYGHYEPKAEILSADNEHSMLQIGDTVLEIGKSTYNDFVRAGITADDAELEKEVTGLYALKLYIGDNIVMETQHRGNDISEKVSECTVDSVNLVFAEYSGIGGYALFDAESLVELHSIYIDGGVRLTASDATINESLGNINWKDVKESEDSDTGHLYKSFWYESAPETAPRDGIDRNSFVIYTTDGVISSFFLSYEKGK